MFVGLPFSFRLWGFKKKKRNTKPCSQRAYRQTRKLKSHNFYDIWGIEGIINKEKSPFNSGGSEKSLTGDVRWVTKWKQCSSLYHYTKPTWVEVQSEAVKIKGLGHAAI